MSAPVVGHLVTCNQCKARTVVTEHGKNVHDELTCKCCGNDHKHGDPETGMTVNPTCRSVTISANAVVLPAGG